MERLPRRLFVKVIGGVIFFLSIAFGTVTGNDSRSITFKSGPDQTVLIELFSSEGCSSCPPADAWMGRLRSRNDLWNTYIPVVFHVDYWDYIGWKDPFASPAYTRRQRTYARLWGNFSVYTPGFVVNGREWKGWFRSPVLPEPSGEKGGFLSVSGTFPHFKAVYRSADQMFKGGRLHAALVGFDLESSVQGGENRGRHLTHQFVVLSHMEKSLNANGSLWKAGFSFPPGSSSNAKRLGLAVWIIGTDETDVKQAAGGPLPR